MAQIVNWFNGTSSGMFEPSWKATALSVIDSIPSTWNGHTVTVAITSVRRNPIPGRKSMHFYGLACDLNIILDGITIVTGTFPNCKSQSTPYTIGGQTYSLHDIYSSLLGNTAKSNGCRWGGDFYPSTPSKWDPMHFDANKSPVGVEGSISPDGDEVIIYSDITAHHPAYDMTEDAGTSSNLESGNAIVHTDLTKVYIGYALNLSDFSSLKGDYPLRDLLSSAGVSSDIADKLALFNGVSGSKAYELYSNNTTVEISEAIATAILGVQIQAIISYLSNQHSIDTKKYPTEISTAIVSYLFGKNLATAENTTDITNIKNILTTSLNIATDLARYIETKAINLVSDIKARRMSEVTLLRSYDPNKSTSSTSSITSTENSTDYEEAVDKLGSQIDTQTEEIKNLLRTGNLFASDPASSEYDDTFNDIDQATLDAIAAIMQSQQVNTDLFFGFKDKEYVYRIKTKNFYSILSRTLNYKISSVEKLVQTESMLKEHQEYSMSKMYSMIPYPSGLAYTIKKNAVKRCEYRIRLIEQRIKNNESSLIGLGFTSLTSFLDNAIFLSTIALRLSVVALAELEYSAKSIFGSLSTLRQQLKLEKGNLAQLKKDMNRYSG